MRRDRDSLGQAAVAYDILSCGRPRVNYSSGVITQPCWRHTESMSLDLSPCLASQPPWQPAESYCIVPPGGAHCSSVLSQPRPLLAGVVGDRSRVWTEADQAARGSAKPVATGTLMCTAQARACYDGFALCSWAGSQRSQERRILPQPRTGEYAPCTKKICQLGSVLG